LRDGRKKEIYRDVWFFHGAIHLTAGLEKILNFSISWFEIFTHTPIGWKWMFWSFASLLWSCYCTPLACNS